MNKISYQNIITLLSLLSLGCTHEKKSLQGMWVDGSNLDYGLPTLIFQNDSLISAQNGFFSIGEYEISKDSITVMDRFHLYDHSLLFKGEARIQYKIAGDSLFYWESKYAKSKYETLVEHYANSKGLKINLPAYSQHSRRIVIMSGILDLFIGYDKNNQINHQFWRGSQKITNIEKEINKLRQTEPYSVWTVRIFADKDMDSGYLMDIERELLRIDLRKVSYITQADDFKYHYNFTGLPIFLHDFQITEVPDLLNAFFNCSHDPDFYCFHFWVALYTPTYPDLRQKRYGRLGK